MSTATQNTVAENSTIQPIWRHKELWLRRSKTFSVEISCHEEPVSEISQELGKYRWCVYAYIYPAHPHFVVFDGTESLFQQACLEVPLHGGPISNASYLRYHYLKDGTTSCVQVGSDYNHLHDEHFTWMLPASAGMIFGDADTLFSWLILKESEADSVSDRVIEPASE